MTEARIVPESASIVFGGGFPRGQALEVRRAGQRAIFYMQRELEAAVICENVSIALCDRGTVDGLAYWPGPDELRNIHAGSRSARCPAFWPRSHT